ncbi:hypothetical protein OKW34_006913 [Paraburkholderia youngii]
MTHNNRLLSESYALNHSKWCFGVTAFALGENAQLETTALQVVEILLKTRLRRCQPDIDINLNIS